MRIEDPWTRLAVARQRLIEAQKGKNADEIRIAEYRVIRADMAVKRAEETLAKLG